jgi:hypothetical protein
MPKESALVVGKGAVQGEEHQHSITVISERLGAGRQF